VSESVDISKFSGALARMRPRVLAATVRAVNAAGEHVIGDAQTLTPVSPTNSKEKGYTGHPGFLRDSATTLPAEVIGNQVSKVIGYGAWYAIFVHEVLTNKHKNGQAKFLETALRRNAAKVRSFIADEVGKAMKSDE
jgi:hypothetical protein